MSVKVQQDFYSPLIASANEVKLKLQKWLKPDSAEYQFAYQLYSLGMIDEQGIVRKELLCQPLPSLLPEEIQTIIDFLKKEVCFVSRDGGQELLRSTLFDIYKEYRTSLSHSFVYPELIGGIVPYLLSGYFKRVFSTCGITFSDPIEKLFQELDTFPSDVDCRFTVDSGQFAFIRFHQDCLRLYSREQLIGLLMHLQVIYGNSRFEHSLKVLCDEGRTLEVMRDAVRVDMLRIEHSLLASYANQFIELLGKENVKGADWIQQNGFKDFCHPFPDSNKHLLIMSVKGKSEELKYDTVVVENSKLPRRHLFSRDALSLPLDPLFLETPTTHPCSDVQISEWISHWVQGWQACIDRLLKVIRIDHIESVDQSGWVMLQVYKTKGYAVLGYGDLAADEIEQTLLKKSMPFDYVRTGDKLISAWENHLHKDPELLYALALHACQSAPSSLALWNYIIKKIADAGSLHQSHANAGKNPKRILEAPAFDRIKKLAFRLWGTRKEVDFSPLLTIVKEMAKEHFFEQAEGALNELLGKPGITAEKLMQAWDGIVAIEFEHAIHRQAPAQLLEALKKRWLGRISVACYAATMTRIVDLFLQDKAAKGYELLKSWDGSASFSAIEFAELEKVLTRHVEQLQKKNATSGLFSLLKIPCVQSLFPLLYSRILAVLIESPSPSQSVKLELIARALDASFIEHSLITLLFGTWPLPPALIQKVSVAGGLICQKLKRENDPRLLLDFARYLELCKIALPEQVLWAVDEISQVADLDAELRQLAVHFFTALLPQCQPSCVSITRLLSLCNTSQAVALLHAARGQVGLEAWLEQSLRSHDDPVLFLNAFGTFLLDTIDVQMPFQVIDFGQWFDQDGSIATGIELLKKYRPAPANVWKVFFSKIATSTKTSYKKALYTVWKEDLRAFVDQDLQALVARLMADSAHSDVFEWLKNPQSFVDSDLALYVYRAALRIAKSSLGSIVEEKVEILDICRAHLRPSLEVDIDLIRVLLSSPSYHHITKGIERAQSLLLENSTLVSNRQLTRAFASFPLELSEPMPERCAELICGFSQVYPELLPLSKAFATLFRTKWLKDCSRVLTACFDRGCNVDTVMLQFFLKQLVCKSLHGTDCAAFLLHPFFATALPKKDQVLLWSMYLKQRLTYVEASNGIEIHRKNHLFFTQNFKNVVGVSDEIMHEVLQLAFDNVFRFAAIFESLDDFKTFYEELVEVIARELKLKVKKVLLPGNGAWALVFVSDNPKVTAVEQDRIFLVNTLLLQSIFQIECTRKDFQIFMRNLAQISLYVLMRIGTTSFQQQLFIFFDQFCYCIPAIEQQLYIEHMQVCSAMLKVAISTKAFGEGGAELMYAIFNKLLYLNLELVSYVHVGRLESKEVKTTLERLSKGLDGFFKQHIDDRFPYSVWRGIFMLNAALPVFIEHGDYDSLEASYEHLFKAVLKVAMYCPLKKNFPVAMEIEEKYKGKTDKEIAALFSDEKSYCFDDKLLYLYGEVSVLALAIRFVKQEFSFLNNQAVLPEDIAKKMGLTLGRMIVEEAGIKQLSAQMEDCKL